MQIDIVLPRSFWIYTVRDGHGRIKARSKPIPNRIVMEGGIFMGDVYYGDAYSPYTATWFIGLLGPGAVTWAAGDTAAKITTGTPSPPTTNHWQEITNYSGTRQPVIWADAMNDIALGPSIQGGVCIFPMTGPGIIQGGILISDATKGGTSGRLYAVDSVATSIGSFAYGAGDTVEVQVIVIFGAVLG